MTSNYVVRPGNCKDLERVRQHWAALAGARSSLARKDKEWYSSAEASAKLVALLLKKREPLNHTGGGGCASTLFGDSSVSPDAVRVAIDDMKSRPISNADIDAIIDDIDSLIRGQFTEAMKPLSTPTNIQALKSSSGPQRQAVMNALISAEIAIINALLKYAYSVRARVHRYRTHPDNFNYDVERRELYRFSEVNRMVDDSLLKRKIRGPLIQQYAPFVAYKYTIANAQDMLKSAVPSARQHVYAVSPTSEGGGEGEGEGEAFLQNLQPPFQSVLNISADCSPDESDDEFFSTLVGGGKHTRRPRR